MTANQRHLAPRSLPTRAPALLLALMVVLVAMLATLVPAGAASATPTSSSAKVSSRVEVLGCATGSRSLGAYYADSRVKVYACGDRPSFDGARTGGGAIVLPYAGSTVYYRGYQCIELVARYLKARFGVNAVVANGAQAVDRYAAAYSTRFVKIANGTKKQAPLVGDVLSLSRSSSFNDVGHTGVVIGSWVNAKGNGTIRSMEQNWGGTGGASGVHVYQVKKWRVSYGAMPNVKWLRTR